MTYYLRLLCYDDPSRETFKQIHLDIPQKMPPKLNYGEWVGVGPDEQDPLMWPQYIVAHLPILSQIDDPHQSGKHACLLRVYLARAEEWSLFPVPEVIQEIIDGERGIDRTHPALGGKIASE